jgi:hypothetical protein
MNGFLLSKRKTFELLLVVLLDLIFYFLWGSADFVILFSFGYVWNWVGSQQDTLKFEGKKYKYSTLKTVLNLQVLVLKPIQKAPYFVKMLARILPAGLFWWGVIVFNESKMPWWAVFIGSFTLELVLLENKIFRQLPPPPPVDIPTQDPPV